MINTHDQIIEAALGFITAGKKAALATVIETWGAAPRPVGAQLAISETGEMVGSVSGGCVEAAVVAEAQAAVRAGTGLILDYGVADEDAFAVGLACGGRIRVMVEPIGVGNGPDQALIEKLAAHRAARDPVALTVNMQDWSRSITRPNGPHADIFASEKSQLQDDLFVGLHLPPLRLVIIGAVHIAQPLLAMAQLTGYDVTLIDPRDSFASPARFPNQTILTDWPDEALTAFGPDARTAIVTLTHDPKLDLPALEVALNSNSFYIGALGSTRTHAKRVDALSNAGFTDPQIARIHGPVGLAIGAKSPAEIAVSILAQMTEQLRNPQMRS